MENEFERKMQEWLEKVATGCDDITTDNEFNMDLDFYAFQSPIFYSPELLIIGANPGGGMKYKEKNIKQKRTRREAKDLTAGSNQFIEHYDDKDWRNLKPLCDLFSGEILRTIFENAVITNLIYFNSGTFNAFKKEKGYKKGLAFCLKMNLELIEILKPKSILLLGKPVKDVFSKFLDKPMETELMADNEKSSLIRKSFYKKTPVYWIQHPSTFGGERIFNYGKHQEKKKTYFENTFRND
jgi:hypothetical protein